MYVCYFCVSDKLTFWFCTFIKRFIYFLCLFLLFSRMISLPKPEREAEKDKTIYNKANPTKLRSQLCKRNLLLYLINESVNCFYIREAVTSSWRWRHNDDTADDDNDDETESCFQLSIGWQNAKTFYSIVPGAQANSWLPSDNRTWIEQTVQVA